MAAGAFFFAAMAALVKVAGARFPTLELVFARSGDLSVDLVPVLQGALAALGSGRGGGRPNYASGGGGKAEKRQVEAALEEAERHTLEALGA